MDRLRPLPGIALTALVLALAPFTARSATSSLLVGNGTYANPGVWSNLVCSSNDVAMMDARLTSTACGWPGSSYLNQTSSQMAGEVLASLPATPYDTWIFYYTGHGDNSPNYSGGLAGVNDNGSGSDLYYPSAFASNVASVGHPVNTCVILDDCGSGGFAKLANIFLQARGINALFLTATNDSLNCAICNSVRGTSDLSYWIDKGLSGLADGACGQAPNGVITFDELDCYLTANYDPLGVPHLYIPNGLGGTGICTSRATPVRRGTWGTLKAIYR